MLHDSCLCSQCPMQAKEDDLQNAHCLSTVHLKDTVSDLDIPSVVCTEMLMLTQSC